MPSKQKEPVLLATVTFDGMVSGKPVTRTYAIAKSEINDIDWFGGDTGDSFFDEMENDGIRFQQRVEDALRGMMWEDADAEAGGEDAEFVGYHDPLSFDCDLNGWKEDDFYPTPAQLTTQKKNRKRKPTLYTVSGVASARSEWKAPKASKVGQKRKSRKRNANDKQRKRVQ
jgi:hypothetical protein